MYENEKLSIDYYKKCEWVRRLINYWEFNTLIKIEMCPFEIYEFDFGDNVGCEFSGRHYGVVLNYSNEENPLVCVAPLKTYKEKKWNHHSTILLGKIDGLDTNKETCCCINQVVSLDKMRVFNKELINKRLKNPNNRTLKLNQNQINVLKNAIIKYFSILLK